MYVLISECHLEFFYLMCTGTIISNVVILSKEQGTPKSNVALATAVLVSGEIRTIVF